jgi:hypothetical protein
MLSSNLGDEVVPHINLDAELAPALLYLSEHFTSDMDLAAEHATSLCGLRGQ